MERRHHPRLTVARASRKRGRGSRGGGEGSPHLGAFYLSHVCTRLYIYVHAAAAAKSLQSCLTLCNPIDGSPPGSPVPGILQARTLEWVAISFSNV